MTGAAERGHLERPKEKGVRGEGREGRRERGEKGERGEGREGRRERGEKGEEDKMAYVLY